MHRSFWENSLVLGETPGACESIRCDWKVLVLSPSRLEESPELGFVSEKKPGVYGGIFPAGGGV